GRSRRSGDAPSHCRPAGLARTSGQPGRLAICDDTAAGAGASRIIPYPRGKVVGGSSAINALAYQRGHPAAYDRWPEGWRFGDLLLYFKRAETFSGGANECRGGGGPLHVLSLAHVSDRTPIAEAFVAAAREL